jgi:pilus assembly protein Flp/PilA
MKAFLKNLMNDADGATALEYGLILALLFIAVSSTIAGFADENGNIWNRVSNSMSNAVASAGP